MLKDPTRPLPPAVRDPAFLALKERVARLGREYDQAMNDMWAEVNPLGWNHEHRQAISILERALKEWEHPQHALDGLERQLNVHRAEVAHLETLLAEREEQEAARNAPAPTVSVASIGQVAGIWNVDANGYIGRIEFHVSGNNVSGRLWIDVHGEWEDLAEVRFDGRTLRFLRPLHDQRYTGELHGGEIIGSFDQNGAGEYSWKMWRD